MPCKQYRTNQKNIPKLITWSTEAKNMSWILELLSIFALFPFENDSTSQCICFTFTGTLAGPTNRITTEKIDFQQLNAYVKCARMNAENRRTIHIFYNAGEASSIPGLIISFIRPIRFQFVQHEILSLSIPFDLSLLLSLHLFLPLILFCLF